MPKKGESKQTFPVDAAFLNGFAARLEYVAKRYREIAGKLGDRDDIRVTGKPTAEKSQGLLEGWMASLQNGLDAAELENLPKHPAARQAAKKTPRQ